MSAELARLHVELEERVARLERLEAQVRFKELDQWIQGYLNELEKVAVRVGELERLQRETDFQFERFEDQVERRLERVQALLEDLQSVQRSISDQLYELDVKTSRR